MSEFALIMIDFQRDFCSSGGYAAQCEGLDWVRPILPNAERLLSLARSHRLTIVHTREGYAPDLSDCFPERLARSKAAGAEYGSMGPLGRLMIRGEYGQDFVDELQPLVGEIVIDKPSYGAFCRSNLEELLHAAGVKRLAIAGVTADVCVHTTMREATDRGFNCYYVKDAISAFDPEIRLACEKMVEVEGGVWGQLTTVDEIGRLWDEMSQSPHVK